MKGCARVWFCYRKHNEKRGFDCCSLLRVKHPEDAGPSLAHNIKRMRISGAHRWAMAQESAKLPLRFLWRKWFLRFFLLPILLRRLFFSLSPHTPRPPPGPQAPSSCARSHSRCSNPGVAFLQVPIQVYKSRCWLVPTPNPGMQIPNVVFCKVPFQLCKSQMLSCARPHSHRCANPGVVSCQAPFPQKYKSRCCLVQGPISHRCANPGVVSFLVPFTQVCKSTCM